MTAIYSLSHFLYFIPLSHESLSAFKPYGHIHQHSCSILKITVAQLSNNKQDHQKVTHCSSYNACLFELFDIYGHSVWFMALSGFF
jgi:hypothetical protein